MSRIAIVLFNLGGPDRLEAVQPFLQNLFADPAILSVPGPLRFLLSRLISRRRAPLAREIYRQIGGRSPLLELTEAQAQALQAGLSDLGQVRVFVAMRYWHPFAAETARAVQAFAPDRLLLLPLYPQYSTTTSASSLQDWARAAAAIGLTVPTQAICCYPQQPGLIAAQADLLRRALQQVPPGQTARVLFSAHGLPERVIERGDPYQWQVERTAAAVAQALGDPALDWRVSYQSRVGPLKWIGPSTEEEIARAGAERRALVIMPIAFVSEHSETLVELDIDYAHKAKEASVPTYIRVPALGTHPDFIAGLAELVRAGLDRSEPLQAGAGHRLCPAACGRCALA